MAAFLYQKKEGNSHLVIVGAPLVLVALFCFGYIVGHMPRRHVEASSKSAVHAGHKAPDLAAPAYKQQSVLDSDSAGTDPTPTGKPSQAQSSGTAAGVSGAAAQSSASQQASAPTESSQQSDGQATPSTNIPAPDDSNSNSQQSSPGLIGGLLHKLF